MKTIECPNCGASLTTSDACCKYCGSANSEYIKPSSPSVNRYTPQNVSNTSSSSSNSEKKFSVGVFIFLLIFFWPGAIIYAIFTSTKNN